MAKSNPTRKLTPRRRRMINEEVERITREGQEDKGKNSKGAKPGSGVSFSGVTYDSDLLSDDWSESIVTQRFPERMNYVCQQVDSEMKEEKCLTSI